MRVLDSTSRLPGLLTIVIGLSLNTWVVGAWLADDGSIETASSRNKILTLQLSCILVGFGIALWPLPIRSSRVMGRFLLFAMIAVAVTGVSANILALRSEFATREARRPWTVMVESEEVILQLAAEMPRLESSVLNLQLPYGSAAELFDDTVRVIDVSSSVTTESIDGIRAAQRNWRIEQQARTAKKEELNLWKIPLSEIDHFEHAQFFLIDGHFIDHDRSRYEARIGFTGLARLPSGHFLDLHAVQHVTWKKDTAAARRDGNGWRIREWRMDDFQAMQSDALLFEETQGEAIGDPSTAQKLRRSAFEDRWRDFLGSDEVFEDPDEDPERVAELLAGTSPGISVIDLNRDGYDDLLIANGDDSVFLENERNGSFADATDRLGVDWNEATATLVADFDNDGDADLFVGRNYARTSYYVNQGGRFVDRSEQLIDGSLPYLVSSMAAADYDGDGLLDLYISTYAYIPLSIEHIYPWLRKGDELLLGQYLAETDAHHAFHLAEAPDANATMNAPGPPNMLLRNTGGGSFEPVSLPNDLRIFRNSFQATWADYDHDGDPDLYIANDYAPNNMLRNDGPKGLVDATDFTGTADVGLGMGVTWGDYDADGIVDLYVSNMYSKAGKRVVHQFQSVDGRLTQLHRGNSLFRGDGDRFKNVSGDRPPAMMVEKAGWSWGSQFVDFNNDGWLDLYAPSGWITAPKGYDIPIDI